MKVITAIFSSIWGLIKKAGAWLKAHPRVDVWLIGILAVGVIFWALQRPVVHTVTTNTSETHEVKVQDTESQAKLAEALQTIKTLQEQINISKKTIDELKKKVVTHTHTVVSPDGTKVTDTTTTTNTDQTSSSDTEIQKKLTETEQTVLTLQSQLNTAQKTIDDLTQKLASKTDTTTTPAAAEALKGVFGGKKGMFSLGLHPLSAWAGANQTPKVTPYFGVDFTYVPFQLWIFDVEASVYVDVPYNTPSQPVFGFDAGLRINF